MKRGVGKESKNMKGAFSLMTLTSANPFDCYFSLNLKRSSLITLAGGVRLNFSQDDFERFLIDLPK